MLRKYQFLVLVWIATTTAQRLIWQWRVPWAQDSLNLPDGLLQQLPISMEVKADLTTTQDSNNTSASPKGGTKVKLPDLPCTTGLECEKWDDPWLVCRGGQCTCQAPYCWVYHLEATGFMTKYMFGCGRCGSLGSSCNATVACDAPGECFGDGYCHCPKGENANNICVVADTSWMYYLAMAGLGSIFLVALCAVSYSCYKDPPWRRPEPWCCGLCQGRKPHKRRGSCEKTPAFTIQSMYNQAFVCEEPAGGVEAGRGDARSEAGDSVSSDLTHTTTVSSDTLTSTSSFPADGASATTTSSSSLSSASSSLSLASSSSPSTASSSSPLTASSSSSNNASTPAGPDPSHVHERCTLCLPRALSSRRPPVTPTLNTLTPSQATPTPSQATPTPSQATPTPSQATPEHGRDLPRQEPDVVDRTSRLARRRGSCSSINSQTYDTPL